VVTVIYRAYWMGKCSRLTEEPQNNIAHVTTTRARTLEGEAFLPCSTDQQHSRNNCQLICRSMEKKLSQDLKGFVAKCLYEACPESQDTSRVGRKGNFLCLLWQHCRRPWSFTCEPCSFGSGRTGFVWVRRVW
jgi:hypothetical protein